MQINLVCKPASIILKVFFPDYPILDHTPIIWPDPREVDSFFIPQTREFKEFEMEFPEIKSLSLEMFRPSITVGKM